MINLDRIGWQNGTLVSKAKVEINGQIYEVEPEEYSGTTPLSAENLRQMETNEEEAINKVDTKIVGETLFLNQNGDNSGNITLSRTIEDFDEIKIDYVISMGDYTINETKRALLRNGSCISLSCLLAHSSQLQLFNMGRYLVSGNSFTRVHETRSRITSSNAVIWDGNSTATYITKITGYKY